jgi:hypothetical protein
VNTSAFSRSNPENCEERDLQLGGMGYYTQQIMSGYAGMSMATIQRTSSYCSTNTVKES